ncbi:hypothetical protein CDD81_4114 [Ophiocordyceps australis]|uniref:Endonuclease/exonuclease/phosphatase domain-containing protein n=1 Tax=Ophiocordyceps australis TaxID=1399860 RepID=A0A2C5YAM8_9HYPO|nr:hypothetical protein CDD81_4114 [Ophiocordyceps australis]
MPDHLPGLLTLVANGPPLTFNYATKTPAPKNWIAVYNAHGGGPDEEKFVSPALAWVYAPKAQDTAHVSVAGLLPGAYKAYFLALDGYKWLAEPIRVMIPGSGPIFFLSKHFTTRNARVGDKFQHKLAGLIANVPDSKTTFAKTKGDAWLQVTDTGILWGTPTAEGKTQVIIEATATNKSKAQLQVDIPVCAKGSQLVTQLSVLTMNMWFGGTPVRDFHRKQVQFLIDSNVDLVGLQESRGGHPTRLAEALGWDYWQSNSAIDLGILSRYPIAESYQPTEAGGSVRVLLDGDESQVMVWNTHLGYTPYGPYNLCFDGMSVEQTIKSEEASSRNREIDEILKRMKPQIANADHRPVILTGDFNAPSHLDWTDKTKDQHCGIGDVPWPTSVKPIAAGLLDSFREVHGDAVAEPGNTWSPIYLYNTDYKKPEPQDRIDFVYFKGLQVIASSVQMVGSPKPEPNHQDNEWTSDHKAVKSVFKVPGKH